jgi:DNA-binding HxlR family transcriptional regulator
MKKPVKPGVPVRGSKTGRPVMVLLDLLGRRWALRVIWELSRHTLTFRDLQTACGDISPTVLNSRLAELRDAGIVGNNDASGYALTQEGERLLAELVGLHDWAERWAKRQS